MEYIYEPEYLMFSRKTVQKLIEDNERLLDALKLIASGHFEGQGLSGTDCAAIAEEVIAIVNND